MAITAAAIIERVRRLESLLLALAREHQLIKAADNPLLYRERRAYLAAIINGVRGLDESRVVLATAMQRMERERK